MATALVLAATLAGDADQVRAALQGGAGELANAANRAGAGADGAAEETQDIQTTAAGRAGTAGHSFYWRRMFFAEVAASSR